MADTMQFDLVSPERSLASLQASAVQIPGAEGDMTVLPDHAALITTLRPGVLKVSGPDGDTDYLVTGGFAEISAAGTSVLAEQATAVADVTKEMLDGLTAEVAAAVDKATPENLDVLNKQAADMAALAAMLGLSG